MYLTTALKVMHRMGDGMAVSVPADMVAWPTGGWLAATSGERIQTHSTSPEREQNSKSPGQLPLKAYGFHTIIPQKNIKSSHC